MRRSVDDRVTLEYEVWEDPGRLSPRTASFYVAAIVPIAGLAADRDLAPLYPGITESENLRDWDPPFPIDLSRIRPVDEEYWRTYRTTPKAFVPLSVGQALWNSRYGRLTSVRLTPPAGMSLGEAREQYAAGLRAAIDPMATGLAVRDVRSEGLAASRGATDFGAYFAYFSFFLVVSAIMLAALFFKLGIEQRVREVGLLRAVGFTTASVGRLFAAEALVLSVAGSLLGVAGALAYGQLMMTGLRTWWVDAVGTTALTLHVSPAVARRRRRRRRDRRARLHLVDASCARAGIGAQPPRGTTRRRSTALRGTPARATAGSAGGRDRVVGARPALTGPRG